MPTGWALSNAKYEIFRTAKTESQNAIRQREETRIPTLRPADVSIAYGCFRYVDKTILCCLTSEAKSAVAFWSAACTRWYGRSLENAFYIGQWQIGCGALGLGRGTMVRVCLSIFYRRRGRLRTILTCAMKLLP